MHIHRATRDRLDMPSQRECGTFDHTIKPPALTWSPDLRVAAMDSPVKADSSIFISQPRPTSCKTVSAYCSYHNGPHSAVCAYKICDMRHQQAGA